MKFFLYCAAVTVLMLSWGRAAYAEDISEVQRLSFGTFSVADNSSQSSLTVTPDNDTFADTAFVVAQNGQRGEYALTGFPPNVTFYLGVDVPNPPSEGGLTLDNQTTASVGSGPNFTLENLTIADGGVMQSNGAGDATLYIGGTLKTSGTGQRYTGGTYNGSYNITIYY